MVRGKEGEEIIARGGCCDSDHRRVGGVRGTGSLRPICGLTNGLPGLSMPGFRRFRVLVVLRWLLEYGDKMFIINV